MSIGEEEILNDTNLNEIEDDLTNLIKEIKRFNSNICLLNHYYIEKYEDKIRDINSIYKNIAKDNNIAYVNIENTGYYLINKDNMYPTINGYEEIGKIIMKVIEK